MSFSFAGIRAPRFHVFLHEGLLMAMALFFPFFQKGLPPLALLLGANAIIYVFRAPTQCVEAFKAKNRYALPLLVLLFYLLYVVGAVFTENPGSALFDLQKRAGFIFFPLLYSFMPHPSRQGVDRILKAFVIGVSVACIIGFCYALGNFYATGWESPYRLYGEYFAYGLHRGYLAIYILFALTVAGQFLLEKRRVVPFFKKGGGMLVFLLLLSALFMTGSRAALVILLPLMLLFILRELSFSWGKKLVLFVGGLCLVGVFLHLFPRTKARVQNLLEVSEKSFEPPEEGGRVGSVRTRLMIWSVALDLYASNWISGVGTGDDDRALHTAYQERGYQSLYERQMDAHCQFLQTGIAVGILGILLLLGIFGKGMIVGMKKEGPLLYLSFILLVAALFESILERQAGILMLAFFVPLLYYRAEDGSS